MRFRRLPGDARRTLLWALLLLPAAALALRLLGYRRVYSALDRSLPVAGAIAPEAAARQAASLASRLRSAALRAPGRPACLPIALVLWAWLRLRGIAAQLQLGVRKVPAASEVGGQASPGLDAHAWVEVAGRAIDATPGPWLALDPAGVRDVGVAAR